LNPRLVDRSAHLPSERIDLFDEMAFTDSADRWIAGHLADVV
jgi:hypothetical protein